MKPHRRSTFVEALHLLRPLLFIQQIGLALVVFLLAVFWLRIPDASKLELVFSAVLAVLILTIAGAGESAILLRLAHQPRTPARLLRGTILVLLAIGLWFAWTLLLEHVSAANPLSAGYLNSRSPHSLRYTFTYSHILLWLGWMWTAIEWLGAGILAALAFALLMSDRPLTVVACAMRSPSYWLTLIGGSVAAAIFTDILVQWTPGHGLNTELLSLFLRLALAVLIDALIVCLALAILGTCARRTNRAYTTPAGTPDDSHVRTAEIP